MDAPEPDQTTFASVSAHTSKLQRQYQTMLDQSTPHVTYRWISLAVLLLLFFVRILYAEGWHIVAYLLGIYLLNLFFSFLQPKFDSSNEAIDNQMEEGAAKSLLTKQDEEFRPFVRYLPEFKFWHSATRAVLISFVFSSFEIFNIPVSWPLLLMYWLILLFFSMGVQIQHMIKYRYVPFTMSKARYNRNAE